MHIICVHNVITFNLTFVINLFKVFYVYSLHNQTFWYKDLHLIVYIMWTQICMLTF